MAVQAPNDYGLTEPWGGDNPWDDWWLKTFGGQPTASQDQSSIVSRIINAINPISSAQAAESPIQSRPNDKPFTIDDIRKKIPPIVPPEQVPPAIRGTVFPELQGILPQGRGSVPPPGPMDASPAPTPAPAPTGPTAWPGSTSYPTGLPQPAAPAGPSILPQARGVAVPPDTGEPVASTTPVKPRAGGSPAAPTRAAPPATTGAGSPFNTFQYQVPGSSYRLNQPAGQGHGPLAGNAPIYTALDLSRLFGRA